MQELNEINRQLGELIGKTDSLNTSHGILRSDIKSLERKVETLSVSDAVDQATNKAHRSLVGSIAAVAISIASPLIVWFVKGGGHG